jgi:hypothetical protein
MSAMLKLIVNNSNTFHRDALSKEIGIKQTVSNYSSQNSFLFDFQETSENLYAFRAQDLDHELSIEMNLERKERFSCSDEGGEEDYLVPVITCDFPHIDVQKLQEKVLGDQYLQGILMFQFQLRILEQLFLFCEGKDAVNLILTIHDADLDYLEIYRRFVISEEEIITERGEQTEIVISTDIETYDEVLDFMDRVDRDLRRTLWRGQKVNPAFQKYLIDHSLPVN